MLISSDGYSVILRRLDRPFKANYTGLMAGINGDVYVLFVCALLLSLPVLCITEKRIYGKQSRNSLWLMIEAVVPGGCNRDITSICLYSGRSRDIQFQAGQSRRIFSI